MNRLFFRDKLIRYFIAFTLVLAIVASGLIASTKVANAASAMAYELVKYDLNTEVYKDHSYKVTEKITVVMPEDQKSLDVALPSGNYQVADVKVKGTSSTVSNGNSGRTLTINDEKKLKKGKHVFEITYTIKEYAERTEEYDIFFYDALLPEWKVPIGNLSIKVSFPDDFPWNDMKYYAGQFGVATNSAKLAYKADPLTKTVTITGNKIPENFSVTLKAQLPDGYWENPLDRTSAGYLIAIQLLVVLFLGLLMWLIGGRDPKVTKTLETHPIEGVLPSDITYIYEGKVRIRDIIALIVYMGTKGYLKISEYAPKKYRLFRMDDPKSEPRFVRNVYNQLFEGVYENRSIDMDELGPRLRRALDKASLDVAAGYSDKSMASQTMLSKIFRILSIILTSLAIATIPILTDVYMYVEIGYAQPIIYGVLAALMLISICRRVDTKYDLDDSHYYFGMGLSFIGYSLAVILPLYHFVSESGMYLVALGALVLAYLNVFICAIMPARARGNAELAMRLSILRKFMYRAKWTHVEEFYKENKDYYYDMFPYALIFSALEAWAKTFSHFDVKAPEWYSDDIEGHAESILRENPTSIDYARDIRSFARTMEDSYYAMIHYHRLGQKKR